MERRTFLQGLVLAGVGALDIRSVQGKEAQSCQPVAPHRLKVTPKNGEETGFERSLNQGDMLFVPARKIWVGTGPNIFDQSQVAGGMVLAAIRARTDIRALPYTIYGQLQIPTTETLVSSKVKGEAGQKKEFEEQIEDRIEELRIAGRGCSLGCTNIRLVAFNALDTKQPSGATILQLLRFRNHTVAS